MAAPAPTLSLHRSLDVGCPLCGHGAARLWLRQGEWQARECQHCGLRFTWPRPGPEEIDALYARAAYYQERNMGSLSESGWRDRAAAIIRCLPRAPRSLIDIGTGEGDLVAAFRALGLECQGVEPSPAGRQAARERHGIDLEPLAPAGPFDAVTFVHSLEHMPDPLAALREAERLLRPEGHVFIEVPHAGSIEMWRPLWRRRILDLPFHLYHFVPETLTRLVSLAGLKVVSVRLFNPDVIEWLLSLRRARPKDLAPASLASDGGAAPQPAWSARRLWRVQLLPWLRRRLPGWKFQVVAAKAEAGAPGSPSRVSYPRP